MGKWASIMSYLITKDKSTGLSNTIPLYDLYLVKVIELHSTGICYNLNFPCVVRDTLHSKLKGPLLARKNQYVCTLLTLHKVAPNLQGPGGLKV